MIYHAMYLLILDIAPILTHTGQIILKTALTDPAVALIPFANETDTFVTNNAFVTKFDDLLEETFQASRVSLLLQPPEACGSDCAEFYSSCETNIDSISLMDRMSGEFDLSFTDVDVWGCSNFEWTAELNYEIEARHSYDDHYYYTHAHDHPHSTVGGWVVFGMFVSVIVGLFIFCIVTDDNCYPRRSYTRANSE